jgi:hypothetical protein
MFQDYLKNAPTNDKEVWATYAGLALFNRRKYEEVIRLLGPMVKSEVWDNKEAYIHAQYYLAASYQQLERTQQAQIIAKRVKSEGFSIDDFDPRMKAFFTEIQNEQYIERLKNR